MTARNWVDVVLTVVLTYLLLVLILFLLSPFVSDIEPFEDAVVGVGPAFGATIGVRWQHNRAAARNARLAKGEAVTMRGSFKAEGKPFPTRWRICRFDLTEGSLRVRPLYYPRSSWSFSLDSVDVLGVERHQGWRRWILTGLKVVACREGQTTFQLSVVIPELPGLLSRVNGAKE